MRQFCVAGFRGVFIESTMYNYDRGAKRESEPIKTSSIFFSPQNQFLFLDFRPAKDREETAECKNIPNTNENCSTSNEATYSQPNAMRDGRMLTSQRRPVRDTWQLIMKARAAAMDGAASAAERYECS